MLMLRFVVHVDLGEEAQVCDFAVRFTGFGFLRSYLEAVTLTNCLTCICLPALSF